MDCSARHFTFPRRQFKYQLNSHVVSNTKELDCDCKWSRIANSQFLLKKVTISEILLHLITYFITCRQIVFLRISLWIWILKKVVFITNRINFLFSFHTFLICFLKHKFHELYQECVQLFWPSQYIFWSNLRLFAPAWSP